MVRQQLLQARETSEAVDIVKGECEFGSGARHAHTEDEAVDLLEK